jgi:riboflavin kinase/FMN adenylyltransferase
MRVIKGLRHLKQLPGGSVVTIGVFDGLHIGHREIIRKVVTAARKTKLTSVVITFDPHPMKVLKPRLKVPSLISLKHRIKLIETLGVDILAVVKFTRSFSKISSEKFVKNILVGKFRMKQIYLGENFYFGNGAKAGAGILRKLSRNYGFRVTTVRPVRAGGHIASSSLIREFILQGKLHEAAGLLGRPVSVLGTVVKGSGIARGLGCPTANINPHHEAIPPRGVYAVMTRLGKRELRGVLNIGFRPTFYSSRDEEPTVEVHIFGFKGNLYNKDIEVYFVKKIRDEVKFKSKAALIERIKKDMETARRIKVLYKTMRIC